MSFRVLFLFSLICFSALSGLSQEIKSPDDNGMQMPIGDINILLDTYEKISGKTLIRDANIPAGLTIRIIMPGTIPKDQALRLLESVLMLNSYALIPGEDNSVKVVNAAGGKNPRSEGIPVYANLADLPKGEQVVTYFMQLKYMSAQEAAPIFQSQVPPHPWGVFVPIPNAQAVAITENASTIRQLAKLQQLIDVPPAKLISNFVSLQRADAERVATIITKLIDDRKSKSQQNAPAAGNNPPPTADNPDQSPLALSADMNERSLVAGEVQLVPDPRTNRILVVTRPVNFEYIKKLIEEFDRAVDLTTPLDRPLKYLVASEILPVLQTILLEGPDDKTLSSNSSGTGAANSSNPTVGRSNGDNANNGSGLGGGSQFEAERTLQDKQNTAPQAVLVGKTRIIADNQANSIIVIGTPENVNKVRTILDSLDKKPMQVYLSTVIGQLTLNDSTELAIDILHKFSRAGDFGSAGSLRTRTDPVLDPASLTSVAAFTALPAGLTLYGAIGSAIDYYVKALASTNRFKLISRPVVYTTNNKGALIASGQKIAVPTSTLTSLNNGAVDSGSVASSIEYTDVELKLEVVPTINSNREVTLKIKQTNDTIIGSNFVSGNSIPTIGTQTVDTTITVPSGATIVLGGLITEDNNTSINGVPYLRDIPILGYLFKGTVKTKNRSELIILIQPTVVGTNEEAAKASQVEVDRNKFGPESKAFSDNIPFVPVDNKKNPPSKKAPRGLSPNAPSNTPNTTPITPGNTSQSSP